MIATYLITVAVELNHKIEEKVLRKSVEDVLFDGLVDFAPDGEGGWVRATNTDVRQVSEIVQNPER